MEETNMFKKEFEKWLSEKSTNKKVISDAVSRVERVNKSYDLDKYYSNGETEELIRFFTYTKKDEREGLEPIATIKIDGSYYDGLASLKRAIKRYFAFLDDTGLVPLSSSVISGPILECNLEDFNRYVGPKLRNVIQTFTKAEKSKQNGVCEYCDEQAVLQSAHREGEERPEIIKRLLKNYEVSKDWYRIDLTQFENDFKKAHTPIRDHIFFLCSKCHDEYDKKKTITTQDIEQKRIRNQFNKKIFDKLDELLEYNKMLVGDTSKWKYDFKDGLNLRKNVLFSSNSVNRDRMNSAIQEWAIKRNKSLYIIEPNGKLFNKIAIEPDEVEHNKIFNTTSGLFALDDNVIDGLNDGHTALFIKDFDKINDRQRRMLLYKFANAPIVLDENGKPVNLYNFLFVIATFSESKDDLFTFMNYESKDCFSSHVDVD